jgi:sulfide:quinone oxidoreductase
MSGPIGAPTLLSVSMRLMTQSDRPVRVLVGGGGVAGLESLIALRTLTGDRAELELISPERTFAWRSLMVAAAFGGSAAPNIEIPEFVQAVEAHCTIDAITEVHSSTGSLTLASGEQRSFDVLLVATGARPEEAIPGAITFGVRRGTGRFRMMLEQAESGEISRLVFAVPAEAGWPLALYELALLTAERLRAACAPVEITLLTPEPAPLAVFGGRASGAVLEDLEDRGIHFVAGLLPEEIAWGELWARPGKVRIQADAVITLPRLCGPAMPGLPFDERGFIPVDEHGLVRGTTNVYAAGDAVAFPIKHGGLAAQQAAAAAEAIAARIGASVTPAPFRPVLRGMLLTGDQPRYLEGEIGGNGGAASFHPLWWPPAKVAGRYLAPYLSGQVTSPPTVPSSVPIELEIDPEVAAARLARAGY